MNFISDIVARIPELLAPPGAEPIDKRIRSGFDLVPGELDVWHNIRGRCFALLAQLCEGLGYESLVRVRCELKARQSELRPEVYTALLDKLTLLQDGALFGNKVANLIALEKLFPGRVPKFEAIASDFIARQLVTDAQFMNAWTRFSQIHEGTCITEECRQLLDQMGSRVQELCGTALSLSGSQAAFVRWAADNDHLLMVRSTGRHEDSDRVMLSGANKTVVGVRPDLQSVRESIGVTLASYFGLSVDQRAMHGCDVSSSFFVPCLLQRMVGEPRTGDPISVSGVMFTQDLPQELRSSVRLMDRAMGWSTEPSLATDIF